MTRSVMETARHARWLLWLAALTHPNGADSAPTSVTIEARSQPVKRRRTWFRKGRGNVEITLDDAMIVRSGLFDREFYRSNQPDVGQSQIDPLEHYLRQGDAEGRSPGAAFDAGLYLILNPDVRAAGSGALRHFLRHGIVEGRLLAVDDPPGIPPPSDAKDGAPEPSARNRAGSPGMGTRLSEEMRALHGAAMARVAAILEEFATTTDTLEFDLYRARTDLHRTGLRNEELLARLGLAQERVQARDLEVAALSRRLHEAERKIEVIETDLGEAERDRADWQARAQRCDEFGRDRAAYGSADPGPDGTGNTP